MSETNDQRYTQRSAETPEFDAEAFGRRFQQIMNGKTEPAAQPEPEKPEKPAEEYHEAPVKKGHPVRKLLAILLACFLLIAAVGVGFGAYATAGYKATALEENAYTDEAALMQAPGVTNILLMGIDTKDTAAKTRSDSMILLTIDTVHGELKLTSFMRDMYVQVPGHGNTKLTHACAYEGPQLTVDTIELNFGIKIDAYCKIGYSLFVDLVNGIGGITVPEIDATESRALAQEGVYIDPGENVHLNGHEALNYCRIRKGQSDFQRTGRQREAITLIVKQALKMNLFKLTKLANKLLSRVECSISRTEFIGLFFKALPLLRGEIGQQQIPADGTWSNATRDGMSVLLVDFEKNKQILKEFIF